MSYSKEEQLYNNKKPGTKERNSFSAKVREEIKEIWGECCYICENPHIELHHVKYRSDSGRGTRRNGLPLCHIHHRDPSKGIHFNRQLRQHIEQLFIETWGEDYYKDEYDLYQEGKISEPSKKLLENYFQEGFEWKLGNG